MYKIHTGKKNPDIRSKEFMNERERERERERESTTLKTFQNIPTVYYLCPSIHVLDLTIFGT